MSSRRCEAHGHILTPCERVGYERCGWCGDYVQEESLPGATLGLQGDAGEAVRRHLADALEALNISTATNGAALIAPSGALVGVLRKKLRAALTILDAVEREHGMTPV